MLGTIDPYYSIYNKIGVDSRVGATTWYQGWQREVALREQEAVLVSRVVAERGRLMERLKEGIDIRAQAHADLQKKIKASIREEPPTRVFERNPWRKHWWPLFRMIYPDFWFEHDKVLLENMRLRDVVKYRFINPSDSFIIRQGFTDEEYTTLLVLHEIGALWPRMLEIFGLEDKVVFTTSFVDHPLTLTKTSVRRRTIYVAPDGFSSEDIERIETLIKKGWEYAPSILEHLGYEEKAEVVEEANGFRIIRCRQPESTKPK